MFNAKFSLAFYLKWSGYEKAPTSPSSKEPIDIGEFPKAEGDLQNESQPEIIKAFNEKNGNPEILGEEKVYNEEDSGNSQSFEEDKVYKAFEETNGNPESLEEDKAMKALDEATSSTTEDWASTTSSMTALEEHTPTQDLSSQEDGSGSGSGSQIELRHRGTTTTTSFYWETTTTAQLLYIMEEYHYLPLHYHYIGMINAIICDCSNYHSIVFEQCFYHYNHNHSINQ